MPQHAQSARCYHALAFSIPAVKFILKMTTVTSNLRETPTKPPVHRDPWFPVLRKVPCSRPCALAVFPCRELRYAAGSSKRNLFCKYLAVQKTPRWSLMCFNPEVPCFLRTYPQRYQSSRRRRSGRPSPGNGTAWTSFDTSAAKKTNGASHLLSSFHMYTHGAF